MRIVIINFSGNTGKSTIAQNLLIPRMPNAEMISVESINADETDGEKVRGDQFNALSKELMLLDDAIVDVGASNVEDYLKLMEQNVGSHEDIDLFLVPTVKDHKQTNDTLSTIHALSVMGVPSEKILILFNRVETTDEITDVFSPIFSAHKKEKDFTINTDAVIYYSELYQELRHLGVSISDLLSDKSDYKAQLKAAESREEKMRIAEFISAQRLAKSATANLDSVFKIIAG
ncbi:StbB family protein [Zymomonas mobilis]|uniref:StbB family protein n=1 Tax=Zymomonas mobilis TaxID=542 RepID=UPI0039EC28BA